MDILHILEHSFFESLNLLPFLFVAYLFLEYLEHKSQKKIIDVVQKSSKFGPLLGSILGLFPHCGFSAMASSFYATRVITLGSLVAVYLATSDEMIPIFLSEGISGSVIFSVLFIKFIFAVVFGFFIDFIFKSKKTKNFQIREFCSCSNCNCEDGIFFSSVRHTFIIWCWIFAFNFILSFIMDFAGVNYITSILSDDFIGTKFIVGIFGLIPNCASSVILAKLYTTGVLSFSSFISGSLVGSGLGLIVLLKMNKSMKENLAIIIMLYFIAVVSGFILQWIGV